MMRLLALFCALMAAFAAFTPDDTWAKHACRYFSMFMKGEVDNLHEIYSPSARLCIHGTCGSVDEMTAKYKGIVEEYHLVNTDTIYKESTLKLH
jgi:hypothetical protein